MVTPRRLQLSRAKGWRKPAGAVIVTRPGWAGNPFRFKRHQHSYELIGPNDASWGSYSLGMTIQQRRIELVGWYAHWITLPEQADLRERIRRELAGSDLLCWCPMPEPGEPDYCHAAVDIDIANGLGAWA